MFTRKYNTAGIIDGIVLVTAGGTDYKLAPTLAEGDVKISKDGATFTNLATLPVVTPAGGSAIRLSLGSGELATRRAVIQFVDVAGAEWEDQEVIVETFGNAGAQFTLDIGLAEVLCDLQKIRGSATAAVNLGGSARGIVLGAAETGTLSTTQMSTDLTEVTVDHYKDRTIIWYTGALAGQNSEVTASSAVGLLTYLAVTDAPADGDLFALL